MEFYKKRHMYRGFPVVERLRLMLAYLQNSNRGVCNGVELDVAIFAEMRTSAFCEMPAVSLDTTNILNLELSSLKRVPSTPESLEESSDSIQAHIRIHSRPLHSTEITQYARKMYKNRLQITPSVLLT